MKKIIFGCAALLSTASFGASVDALSNATPAYLGNPAQNATMTAEAAFYNPAGLTELEDGNYISGGMQMAYTKFSLQSDQKKYTGRDPKGAVPDLSFVHKSGNFAYFLNTGGAAGGAEINYKDGVPLIDTLTENIATSQPGPGGTVKGKNAYVMVNTGVAYKLNDKISLSTGLKYIYAERIVDISVNDGGHIAGDLNVQERSGIVKLAMENMTLEQQQTTVKHVYKTLVIAKDPQANKFAQISQSKNPQAIIGFIATNDTAFKAATGNKLTGTAVAGSIHAERTAQGMGGTFGINYKPTDKWNMALNYNTMVKLDFKTKTKYNGDLGRNFADIAAEDSAAALRPLVDGNKQRRDLPAELKYGTAYKLTDKFTVMAGANYYFLKDAKTDGKSGFDNGWEANLGAEYQLTEKLTLTGGYNYAHTGGGKETFSEVDTPLNSNIFTVGFKYQQTPNLQWTLGTMLVSYVSQTVSGRQTNVGPMGQPEDIEYKKNIIATGLGLTYKF